MKTKKTVQLQITSMSDGGQIQQYFQAELFLKGMHIYVRYAEVDPDMGQTTTTLKFAMQLNADPENDTIRIIRHGEIQSEQSFVLHKLRTGFYQTPQGNMDMVTYTHWLSLNLNDEYMGEVIWNYDLFVSGDLAGTYILKVEILADEGLQRFGGTDFAG